MIDFYSNDAISLIKRFEGCRLTAYLDPASVATIGWGHTAGVKLGDKWSQETADKVFVSDLDSFVEDLNSLKLTLNQHQYDAMLSFIYNLGLGQVAGSSLVRFIREGRYDLAADEFEKWVHAGGRIIGGLVRRREAERQLFVTFCPDADRLFLSQAGIQTILPPKFVSDFGDLLADYGIIIK